MKKIYLTRGKIALVDDKDFILLSRFKWRTLKTANDRTFYAIRSLPRVAGESRKFVYMHREIMATPKGFCVDHINGDGLDNRRNNLRNVTQSMNALNQVRLSKRNKSGFVGVYWSKQKGKWHALVAFKEGSKHIGFFDDVVEAANQVKTYRATILKT